jgi:hypothetical protein
METEAVNFLKLHVNLFLPHYHDWREELYYVVAPIRIEPCPVGSSLNNNNQTKLISITYFSRCYSMAE